MPFRWNTLLLVLAVLMLACLLLPFLGSAREAARRAWCVNNLKQIGLALYNYHEAYKCFPPAYIADNNGKPAHSWRVLILPYLGEKKLYEQYKFNEPWNGPNNKKLLASRPYGYACPSDSYTWYEGPYTSYVAVVGSNAAWPGKKPGRVEDINARGGLSNTVAVAEVADARIPWTEPKDLSLDALSGAQSPPAVTLSSKHVPDDEFLTYSCRAGANVALADGGVRFLPAGLLASDKFPDLLKIGGIREEYFDTDWPVDKRIHWPHCIAFVVWFALSVWLLVRAVRNRKAPAEHATENAA